MTTFSLSTKGKAVSAYTGSPLRAVLVEIACFSERGIEVPAGMVITVFAASTFSDRKLATEDGASGSEAGGVCAMATCVSNNAKIKGTIFIGEPALALYFEMRSLRYQLAAAPTIKDTGCVLSNRCFV